MPSARPSPGAIHASARSFFHHQVRSIPGGLKLVGEGKWTPAGLHARRRMRCGGLMVPSAGLYLMRVDYDAVPQPPTTP